jgi:hypothetical protein
MCDAPPRCKKSKVGQKTISVEAGGTSGSAADVRGFACDTWGNGGSGFGALSWCVVAIPSSILPFQPSLLDNADADPLSEA